MTDTSLLQPPPLSLYIHIPWCVRKCPYCDFNSHENPGDLPEDNYIQALFEDLEHDLHYVQGRPLQSIFFGGGTPSLFSAPGIGAILEGIQRRLAFSPDIEITLEANPGTAEQDKFSAYRDAGVNRLSIGVQSFQPLQLSRLGRIHNSEEAIAAIQMAKTAGFKRFNVDLMHGLPGQNTDEALLDLRTALDMGVHHLSWYQLTIEPNTTFYKQPPVLPEENLLSDIQEAGHNLLLHYGLTQYEVSAYATPGEVSRHNLNYWRFGDYLGIGAGAHSKITQSRQKTIKRFQKTRKPEDYLDRSGSRTSREQALSPEELPLEYMMNALRLTEGFTRQLFVEHTGLDWKVLTTPLQDAQRRGLIHVGDEIVAPTELGRRYLNDLIALFM